MSTRPEQSLLNGCKLSSMTTLHHTSRRSFLTAALGATAALPVLAQQQSISPNATPRDWSGQVPVRYPDPDIVAIDNRFRKYMVGNTVIHRLYTGTQWLLGA